jgi:hypothetical protein
MLQGSGSFAVLQGTKLIATIPTGSPDAVYNPSNGYVYTLAGDIYNGKTNAHLNYVAYNPLCGGQPVAVPTSIIYVAYDKMVYISGYAAANSCNIHDFIEEISGTTLKSVVNLPTITDTNDVMNFDPANKGLYVGGVTSLNTGYAHLKIINVTNNKLVSSFAFSCASNSSGCSVSPFLYSPYNRNMYFIISEESSGGNFSTNLGMINSFTDNITLNIADLDTTNGFATTFDSSNSAIYVITGSYPLHGPSGGWSANLYVVSTVTNSIVATFYDLNGGYGSPFYGITYDPLNTHVYATVAFFYPTMYVISS